MQLFICNSSYAALHMQLFTCIFTNLYGTKYSLLHLPENFKNPDQYLGVLRQFFSKS